MLFRKNAQELIDSAKLSIKNAILNFLAAKNILEQLKRKGVDTLLMQTAFAGLPVPSKVLASIYVRSGIDQISKALKKLRKADKICRDNYAHIYMLTLHSYFNSLESILSSLTKDVKNIDEAILTLEDVMIKLQELRDILNEYGSR